MPLIYQHRIYRADLKANPNVLYVFGGLNAAFQAKSDGFTLKLQ